MPRYAAMWSGGKDSALAVMRARQNGLDVALLLNFYDAGSSRVRFHATRADVIAAQAVATGIALRQVATSWEAFEPSFRASLDQLRDEDFAGVIFGDIHLADVRAWYEERVRATGLEHVEPIWGERPADLLSELVASGLRAVVSCVELARLDESWLGRVIDEAFARDVAQLRIDPCGENGEYHSFAYDGPLFRHPVVWQRGERRGESGFAQIDVLDAGGDVARATVRDWPELAEGTRTSRPKAWAALSAHGVIALRDRIGHPLSDRERRALWDALWRAARREPTAGR